MARDLAEYTWWYGGSSQEEYEAERELVGEPYDPEEEDHGYTPEGFDQAFPEWMFRNPGSIQTLNDEQLLALKADHAENGRKAVELFCESLPGQYRAVLMDIQMPVMNGLEMIEKIREIYDGKKRIIVITGYMDDEHYTDMADVYLYKPLNLQHLIDAIEGLLPTLRK